MSSRRAPSPPPQIPGFEFRKVIGTGGFSDVFLYEQQRPRRRVAVKVLLDEWSTVAQRSAFDHEADLMATLGNHPSIVTMYEAGTASDGRAFLAMEYCSRANLGARYRTERMPLAEAMRTTIQIAGAVETAHRLGILHRDIKPANILVTQFGHPALTDFGISSRVDAAAVAEGMSIPWSPPESFTDPPTTGVATDVWALGATFYSLLAGRTPFEVRGSSNTSADLMGRITSTELAPTGRGDVPESLERVLRIAMAKNPASRYSSALAFARAVQQVQVELAHGMTPIDLLDESGAVQEEDDDGDGTRMNRVVAIDPDGPARPAAATPPAFRFVDPAAAVVSPSRPAVAAPQASALDVVPVVDPVPGGGFGPVPVPSGPRYDAEPMVDETVHRPAATSTASLSDEAPPRERSGRAWIAVAAGAVGVVAVGGLVWWVTSMTADGGEEPQDGSGTVAQTAAPQDPVVGYVPPVRDLQATAEGSEVVVTWTPPRESEPDDEYGWRVLSFESESQYTHTTETTASVTRDESQKTCVEVVVIRGTTSISTQVEQVCVAPEGA